jgi:hypothetical protein
MAEMTATRQITLGKPPEGVRYVNIYDFSGETQHLVTGTDSAPNEPVSDCKPRRNWLAALTLVIGLIIFACHVRWPEVKAFWSGYIALIAYLAIWFCDGDSRVDDINEEMDRA